MEVGAQYGDGVWEWDMGRGNEIGAFRSLRRGGVSIGYTTRWRCITGFYHAIPGGYIYACLYGNTSLKGIKTR